jgi:hypothetical protein
MCRWGFSSIVKTLKDVPDDRVRAYIIWLPVFGGDFKGQAEKLSRSFPDRRVSYFLDPESLSGESWEDILKTGHPVAWDVYLIYGASAEWQPELLAPDFWMHQLGGVTNAPRLNQPEFETKLPEMVNSVKQNEGSSGDPAEGTHKTMRIEFLYFSEGCPSYKQALANLKAALRETHSRADLVLINVNSPEKAEQVGFQGSPSIRINGQDLEGRNQGSSYSCRLYRIDGKATPIPSKDFIEKKLLGYKLRDPVFRSRPDEASPYPTRQQQHYTPRRPDRAEARYGCPLLSG